METIVEWFLSEKTILPLKFQLNVVNWQLAKTEQIHLNLCLNWILKYWNIRYQNILEKKSEFFVYKKRTNDEINFDNNDIFDEDKFEV